MENLDTYAEAKVVVKRIGKNAVLTVSDNEGKEMAIGMTQSEAYDLSYELGNFKFKDDSSEE
jgi:hypothetical protein